MASSSKQLAKTDDYGRQIQQGTENLIRGDLIDREFSSRCSSDVQLNTRIVIVCEITDFNEDVDDISSSENEKSTSSRKTDAFSFVSKL